MSHRNARLTFHGRKLLVHRIRVEGMPVAHAADASGVSRQCAHRWLDRYDKEGEAGLHDRSSRPKTMPTQTPREVEARVVAARVEHRRGQDWLGAELGVAPRTVNRILHRHQLPMLATLDPLTGVPIRSSKRTAVRYERSRPGELVHMDVKKIGRIPDGGGWRAHGREMGSTSARKKTPVGYDYVHAVVDDHSRLAFAEIHRDERADTVAGFFERAIQFFASHGVRIERLMTDNAFAYRHGRRLHALLEEHQIRHKFIRPHCPWQNGKVERFNRTLQTEWAYRYVFTSNDARTAALPDFLDTYNNRRRHAALGGMPPISRLSPT